MQALLTRTRPFVNPSHHPAKRVAGAVLACLLAVACGKQPGADARSAGATTSGPGLGGTNQGSPGITPLGTAGGGSTSGGNGAGTGAQSSGPASTPAGRETSTLSGAGTSNPGPGGSGMAGPALTGSGAAIAPGADSVKNSASGARTAGGGIPNAPGMAAGPNGRRSTSEGSPGSQR